MTVRVAIADDEPLARRRLRSLLERDAELVIVAECKNGPDTADALARMQPDIVFLDVRMPGLDGLSIAEQLAGDQRPQIVLVTAHDRYALRAFDIAAVDYLLKPYDDERFAIALDRAKTAVVLRSPRQPRRADHLAVRGPRGTTLVAIDAIDWLESADNYVELHVGTEHHLLRTTLAELEERLAAAEFERVHRRVIVNLRRVRRLQPTTHGDFRIELDTGATIPLSRRYKARLERRLGVAL